MLSRMGHPLDGSRAKVSRAGDHLEVLESALARFVRDGGFSIATEDDSDSEEYVFRVHSNLKPLVPPSPAISIVVGDILNNLRSALDYVIWQLAKSPSIKNQFPIFSTPEGFKEKRGRYLRSVPRKHWALIESYQPYPGRDANGEIGRLATLNDVDKHHLLLAGAMAFSGRKGRFSVSGLDSIKITGRDWVAFEDGAEVYRIKMKAVGSQVKVEGTVPYTIIFGDPSSGIGATIQDLRNIRVIVSNVVESFGPAFD